MRGIASVIAVLLLATAVLAAQQALSASVPDAASSFRIPNCNNVDGPSKQHIRITIDNPLPDFMAVNYYLYNLSSGEWESMGKLCNAPGMQMTACDTDLLIATGNQGNATTTHDLIRLVATTETSQDTYEKTFSFAVTHYAADREATLVSQIAGNNTALSRARDQCAAKPACCTMALSGNLDAAEAKIRTSNDSVSGCHLVDAYSLLQQGEMLVRNTTTALAPCNLQATPTPATTPLHTPTPSSSPAPSQTASATPAGGTPTPEESVTPAATPTPTPAKACPMGLLLMLLGAGTFLLKR
jgi:hypothetical protein